MKIRGITVSFDETNYEDVQKVEKSYATFQRNYASAQEAKTQSERLQIGCTATIDFLDGLFGEGFVEQTGVNTHSVRDLLMLLGDAMDAIAEASQETTTRLAEINDKYSNRRA